MKQFYLGVDLGQARDYTALTLTERIAPPKLPEPETPPEPMWRTSWERGRPLPEPPKPPKVPPTYICRKIRRLRGVSYGEIVEHIGKVMNQDELKGKVALVVDGTGVGRGPVDEMRKARLNPSALTITAGNTITHDAGYTRVPKIELVTVMQMLLQDRRLEINADEPDAAVLQAELLNFRAKITLAANTTFGAGAAPDWREGAHDDLVLSLALAMWCAERLENTPTVRVRKPWGMRY